MVGSIIDGEDMDATQAVAPGSPTQQDDMDATQVVINSQVS